MNLECTNKFSILCVNDPEENVTSDLETHFSQKNKTKKAKGKPLSKGPLKRNVIDEKIVCTLKTDPVISRCKGCFQSHFPYPKYCRNSKITSCKIERRKKDFLLTFLNRGRDNSENLCGGLDNNENSIPKMIRRAIENGRKHGISLVHGVKNRADGNCTFESVLNNINFRSCFRSKLPLHPDVYRKIWVTDLEEESKRNPMIAPGFTEDVKRENWEKLKMPKVYNIPFFGDLLIHAIARGCKKNILIFNTSTKAFDPIYVVKGNQFGGAVDTDIPVVLAYNQVHYESLHPSSLEDIEKTQSLVNTYITGNYEFHRKDRLF